MCEDVKSAQLNWQYSNYANVAVKIFQAIQDPKGLDLLGREFQAIQDPKGLDLLGREFDTGFSVLLVPHIRFAKQTTFEAYTFLYLLE